MKKSLNMYVSGSAYSFAYNEVDKKHCWLRRGLICFCSYENGTAYRTRTNFDMQLTRRQIKKTSVFFKFRMEMEHTPNHFGVEEALQNQLGILL